MSLLKEFRDFAVKGNVLDLAVGVIIGGAFGKIVSALTDKLIMPPLGMLLGRVNFSQLKLVIQAAQTGADGKEMAKEVAIEYGAFIQTLLDFTILAFVIFMMVRGFNALRQAQPPAPAAPAEPPASEKLLAEIRDLLKKERSS